MGVITVQRCMRRCDNWIEHWPDGPIGNTRSCADIYAEQHTGLRVSHAEIQGCLHTGRWACGVAPWREPDELRDAPSPESIPSCEDGTVTSAMAKSIRSRT